MAVKSTEGSKRRRVQAEIETRTNNLHERRLLERSMNREQTEDLLTSMQCECSDKNCGKRIVLTLRERDAMRKNSRHFIVAPGHVDTEVERVVANYRKCLVVEKFSVMV